MILLLAFFCSILALVVVGFLTWNVLRKPGGDEKMRKLSLLIQDGARTFLKREYKVVSWVVILLAILIATAPLFIKRVQIGWATAVAFITGAFCSGLAGYMAMSIATRSNARTTEAAKRGLKEALEISFSAGAITGLSIAGVALLGLLAMYTLFEGKPVVINGYAMGASLMALFARTGGGIYTKGADMGADLVGKVEAGIPEDDPRNPAVIADNVGDNVGDIAGLGADLLESYVEAIIAAIAIGYSIFLSMHTGPEIVLLPFAIASWGIVSSIVGILSLRMVPVRDPQKALNFGVYLATVVMIAGSFFIVKQIGMSFQGYGVMGPFWAIVSGLITGLIIGTVSEFYSSSRFMPVRNLAKSAQSGPAVVIVGGLSLGMASSLIPAVVIAGASLLGFKLAGMYGVAMGALGMLSTLGITLAVDSYGPVADNAGGIAEMTEQGEKIRKVTDQLDSIGNTTAAIGKGFAIGSAAFAALALITAYLTTLNRFAKTPIVLNLGDPKLLVGLLIGGMIPFLFSALLAGGVGRIANKIIEEVRRQFKEIKGLMEGRVSPDSSLCVDIAAKGALTNMMVPGILAIVIPVGIGFLLGPVALGGILVGSLITGLPLAIQMANSGAALDNAKKFIEEGNFGGKGTEAHKAAVVGDTFGDPLKDTMGPSINILIKLMSIVSLVLAPIIAQFG